MDDSVYQSYIQVRNDAVSESMGEDYWENYTCAIKYTKDNEQINTDNLWAAGSCGTPLLSLIENQPFTGIRTDKTCNPYYPDYEESKTEQGSEVTCSFFRLFEYNDVQDYSLR